MSATATRLAPFAAGLIVLSTLGWVLTSQAAPPVHQRMPLPTDWTHRHVIYSQPGNADEARLVEHDPRFLQQWQRRNQVRTLHLDEAMARSILLHTSNAHRRTGTFERDWSLNLGSLTVTSPPPLAAVYPIKFSFDSTTADCTNDFVVFSTGDVGSATQPNIVAFNNLYSGCGGTVPNLLWAFNITSLDISTGAVYTTPVFSLDGTQIAFVQHNTSPSPFGTLILLKWNNGGGTLGAPTTPTAVLPTAYPNCTAPCMTTFFLEAGPGPGPGTFTDDTNSWVFYDYESDTAFIGDSEGWLHKFTPVFKGTAVTKPPTEIRSIGTNVWPAQTGNDSQLTSPVFDETSGNVFVGDASGFLYSVNSTTGAVTKSNQLVFNAGIGMNAPPIVDVTRQLVYAFSSDDGSLACATNTLDCAGVFQFPTTFTSGATGLEVVVGNAGNSSATPTPVGANPIYSGDFDNAYINSTNGTGNLYVCGNTGASPTVYQVPITSGVMQQSGTVAALATTANKPICSPITDVPVPSATAGNPTTEQFYVSVQSESNAANCASSGGCALSFVDTPWQASTTFGVGQEILVKSTGAVRRFIQTVIATTGSGATSGTTQPAWGTSGGGTRTDGGLTWINQGNPNFPPTVVWGADTAYAANTRLLDPANNVEIVTTAGTSGGAEPTWPTSAGGTVVDGTVTWTNAGAFPIVAFPVTGGASGMIIDNTVTTGTPSGGSNVYFTTLGNQTCATSGTTGGCAVQASQSGLTQ